MGEPMDSFASTFITFIICDSPQKSSTVRKVYKPNREPLLDSTSPSLLRNATSPTEGRPWHSVKLRLFARGSPTRGAVEELATRLRGCTKGSLSSVGKSGSWHLLYLFGEKSGIMGLRFTPRISRERRWTRWPIFSHFWYLSEQM